MKKIVALIGLAFVLSACGEKTDTSKETATPTQTQSGQATPAAPATPATPAQNGAVKIDATDQMKFQESVAKASVALPEADRIKFATAILTISAKIAQEAQNDEQKAMKLLKEKFDGKTAAEIMQAGGQ